MRTLAALRWDNRYARLPEAFFQRVAPTPLPAPYLVAFNPDVAALLDLDPAVAADPAFTAWIGGGAILPGTEPLAAVYAGHQFGVWVPQLGDGRAILLGELLTARHTRWDIQVKGGGLTRYSRMGDGRAVLRSTVREYLASEAMAGLGIPTTRALAIVGSDHPVYRERAETAAVLVRVAPTHVRFGTFQFFAARGRPDDVRRLADHVIEAHFPSLLAVPEAARYAAWYREVVERTARLMAQWTAVGFAHGVMNTDNFSITGLTLDYGPYGWLDAYDPAFVCNHSDASGRYAFDQQPMIGLWNCARLGEALHPLVPEADALGALEGYRGVFEREIGDRMRAKLGLRTAEPDDVGLLADLLHLLHEGAIDYTRFFRALSRYAPDDPASLAAMREETGDPAALDRWLGAYGTRLAHETSDDGERHRRMLAVNPKYVLRNWIAQEAIDTAETRLYDRIEEIRTVLAAPFDEHPAFERFAEPPIEGMPPIVVSCSS